MTTFNNRVFGLVMVKSINSNYNADFTHQPRTLPDGIVYATDKALKYSVKNYLKDQYTDQKIFYFKSLNEKLNPLTLDETYQKYFGEYPTIKVKNKDEVDKKSILNNLVKCLDIRLFGATFAGETNISIHGPVQINHGINCFANNEIYSEQIMSPFRNPGDADSAEKGMTTLGQQSKLREGHYVHHFSINPKNLDWCKDLCENFDGLSIDDISKLKDSLRKGVTYYDSASKAGTDNELLLWVQLKETSRLVLPVFTEMVKVERNGHKVVIDLEEVKKSLAGVNDIEKIELYYQPENTVVENIPENIKCYNLILNTEIN